MTAPTPKQEPLQITPGDSVTWKKTFQDYPAGTYTLSYVMINASGKFTITAGADGSDHLVTLSGTDTGKYTPGIYKWQAYLTDASSNRTTMESGEIEILTDFSSANAFDTRSQVKQTLDAIEAVIFGRASKDQQMYMIGNRRLQLTPIPDLLVLRDRYKALYIAEQNAEGLRNGEKPKNRVYVRV